MPVRVKKTRQNKKAWRGVSADNMNISYPDGLRCSRSNCNQRDDCRAFVSNSRTLFACEGREFLHDPLINRPFEGNDQLGQILDRLPAPVDEFGLWVAAAGARG